MITTGDTFGIEDGDKRLFAAASIYCIPTYYADIEITGIEVIVTGGISDTDFKVLASFRLEITNSDLGEFTASGANDVLKYYNLVEQAVKDYLEGLTVNSSATFTIA